MHSSGLHGPYRLDPDTIDLMVPRVSPGAFALGTERGATFYVACVGRSDDDLAGTLKGLVGSYVHFKFRYADSAYEAFVKQCELYHDFGPKGLHDTVHPKRAESSDWQCPRCSAYAAEAGEPA